MTTPHPRLVAFVLLLLLVGGALRADGQSPRLGGGRDDRSLLAQAFPGTYRVETTAARNSDRYPTAPAPAPAPVPQQRRTRTSYYPAMGTGQYANRPVHAAHCTPSRVSLALGR
ncbi:MAG TPA: hypothetical protein VGH33_02330 [Isosphaeraceae bacterium]